MSGGVGFFVIRPRRSQAAAGEWFVDSRPQALPKNTMPLKQAGSRDIRVGNLWYRPVQAGDKQALLQRDRHIPYIDALFDIRVVEGRNDIPGTVELDFRRPVEAFMGSSCDPGHQDVSIYLILNDGGNQIYYTFRGDISPLSVNQTRLIFRQEGAPLRFRPA